MNKFCLILIFSIFVSCAIAEERKAIAIISVPSSGITGNVTFQQMDGQPVFISGIVEGLPKGQHGFHVHESGDVSTCGNTKGHYNPHNKTHGNRNDTERHVGDLGNIISENGVAMFNFTDDVISLSGENNIIGRAIVIHEKEDDYGKGNSTLSKTTGNAGSRLACAVIGILKPLTPWESSGAIKISTFSLGVLSIAAIIRYI